MTNLCDVSSQKMEREQKKLENSDLVLLYWRTTSEPETKVSKTSR